MATDTPRITEHGVATLPDQAWERARRRTEIIGPLAQSETVGHEAADVVFRRRLHQFTGLAAVCA